MTRIVKMDFRWADIPILEHQTFSLKLIIETSDNEVYCSWLLKHTF